MRQEIVVRVHPDTQDQRLALFHRLDFLDVANGIRVRKPIKPFARVLCRYSCQPPRRKCWKAADVQHCSIGTHDVLGVDSGDEIIQADTIENEVTIRRVRVAVNDSVQPQLQTNQQALTYRSYKNMVPS